MGRLVLDSILANIRSLALIIKECTKRGCCRYYRKPIKDRRYKR